MTFQLAHTVHHDGDAPTTRGIFVLHGIFGSGRNWRGFAKGLAAAHPDRAVVTVDLRNHGDSRPAPPPHTLDACAEDLLRLAAELELAPEVVVGHSFGGKVALAVAEAAPWGLETTWVLDSPPGAGPPGGGSPSASEVGRMIAFLDEVEMPLERRSAVTDLLLERGFSRGVATWMATNLRGDGAGGYVWNFDVAGLKALLDDYWDRDFLPLLRDPASGLGEVHLVRALESDRWSRADLESLRGLEDVPGRTVHPFEGAGHWLHVDRPDALLALVGERLPT